MELSFRMNEAGLSKMGTDWLRQLKERLDSGEWLTHTPEGEPEGILTGVFVDQTRRIGLVYQQPGDDQYFQIFLNPDGTKADAFWSSRKNSEPEVYSEDEMSAIEQHIKTPLVSLRMCSMSWFLLTSMWTSALFHPLMSGTITHW